MKRLLRPALVLGISLMIALTSAALTQVILPKEGSNLAAAAFFLQTTPTPEQADQSQVGSTDGIAIMGFVLVSIVVLPILLRRKAWVNPQ